MGGTLRQNVANTLRRKSGERFWVKKTITSSAITTAAQDLTSVATGTLYLAQAILKTDATGLAGATNFELKSNNAKGSANFMVETVANLGANITKILALGGDQNVNGTVAASTCTVTSNPIILEPGKKLQFDGTVSAGTGAGTIDVWLLFERIDENAQITNA